MEKILQKIVNTLFKGKVKSVCKVASQKKKKKKKKIMWEVLAF